MAETPSSAAASPSPVTTSIPVARDMGTTSWPRSVSTSTTWRPARPVAPATAILVLVFMAPSSSCGDPVTSARFGRSER
ncbi:MAG TPA: hypothetical protein VNN79_22600 [Actinomycetota bacterium]|nr:hypothetical protein [Actinomycetota bacterium]